MIPAGYLLKRIAPRPEWLKAPQVTAVYSVADCVSSDAVDIQRQWQHNAMGVASDPQTLWDLARQEGLDVSEARLFYYEVHERQIDFDGLGRRRWQPLSRLPSAAEDATVVRPSRPTQLAGYDVVVSQDFLEHSPLSCNSVAEHLPVNEYCLLAELDQAVQAIEGGVFNLCEPGIYRIFAVHEIEAKP